MNQNKLSRLLVPLLLVLALVLPMPNAWAASDEIEQVTLDVYITSAGENPMTPGIQNDAVAQYIREKTGVTLNIVLTDSNKTNAMTALGDLYDLGNMPATSVPPLIQSGSLAALDDYMYLAPSLTENFAGLVNYSREFMSNGQNKVYVLCFRGKTEASPLATSRYGTFVRWEWYKEAGSPEIKNYDDLLSLMTTIQANHPTTEDGKRTYAFSAFDAWGVQHMMGGSIIWKNYAQYSIGVSSAMAFKLDDLSLLSYYDADHYFWKASDLFFKANQQGILDPEAYTQRWEDYGQKVASGQVLLSGMEWDVDANNAEFMANGTKDKYVDIQWADIPELPTWVSRASEFGMTARTFVVSSKCVRRN
ncbi:hypothetical protein FACS1894184_13500 [Clostridia bacterium]|nr:hypothetical protein FACS1894184_13500 [Clostridia bacterium]